MYITQKLLVILTYQWQARKSLDYNEIQEVYHAGETGSSPGRKNTTSLKIIKVLPLL